jgi:hypothetical protein
MISLLIKSVGALGEAKKKSSIPDAAGYHCRLPDRREWNAPEPVPLEMPLFSRG